MKRDRATKILERVLATIETGKVPVPILEVWVFGSYARGAPEPGDIDLIIVHEPISESLKTALEAEARSKRLAWTRELCYSANKHRSMITTALRKPGESLDILLGASLEEVLRHYAVANDGTKVLLWSPCQPDWRAALSLIAVNLAAKRADRREFVSCKRARCSLEEMELLTGWIERGVIAAKRIEAPAWPVGLSDEAQERMSFLLRIDSFGRASQACLPLGLWWLELMGCSQPAVDQKVLTNGRFWPAFVAPTLRVTFGTLNPAGIAWFLNQPDAVAAAHVLHFKRGEPKEVLEFRRGPPGRISTEPGPTGGPDGGSA